MSSVRPPVLKRILRPVQWLARGRLRVRALVAVVLVTLVVLVAFDVAAITALNSYLMNQTDTSLRNAASLVRPDLNELPAGAQTPTVEPEGNGLIENKSDSEWSTSWVVGVDPPVHRGPLRV